MRSDTGWVGLCSCEPLIPCACTFYLLGFLIFWARWGKWTLGAQFTGALRSKRSEFPCACSRPSTAPRQGWATKGQHLVQRGRALPGGAGASLQDRGSQEWIPNRSCACREPEVILCTEGMENARQMQRHLHLHSIQIPEMAGGAVSTHATCFVEACLFLKSFLFSQRKSQITSSWINIWK